MRNLLFILIGLFVLGCNQTVVNTNQKCSDSEYLVASTNWYQQSAEMKACYYQAYYLAKLQLKINNDEYTGDKSTAVVLDIDETVLDNSPFQAMLIKTGQTYNSKLWKEWTDLGKAKALPGVLDFTLFAKEQGVEVFYVSNRKVEELGPTLSNLHELGFPNADSAYVMLRGKSRDKSERRAKVQEQHEIILYIGDNLTDFSQDYEERGTDLGFAKVKNDSQLFGSKYIILPNPMYGNWEGSIYNNNYSLTNSEKQKLRKDILKAY